MAVARFVEQMAKDATEAVREAEQSRLDDELRRFQDHVWGRNSVREDHTSWMGRRVGT